PRLPLIRVGGRNSEECARALSFPLLQFPPHVISPQYPRPTKPTNTPFFSFFTQQVHGSVHALRTQSRSAQAQGRRRTLPPAPRKAQARRCRGGRRHKYHRLYCRCGQHCCGRRRRRRCQKINPRRGETKAILR
ncbi:unnamed protein product, partial [Sphacelaria rigidula]